MKIIIGSDHAGFGAKEEVKQILTKLNYKFQDEGTYTKDSINYPIIAEKVCTKVLQEKTLGILICGSGEGMQIAANKIKGIRADLCFDEYSAKMARLDNDANVLCLRAREFNHDLYPIIVKTFLSTKFSDEERHKKRLEEIKKLEDKYL